MSEMYGKIKITADLHLLTGMHIGGSNIFSSIGSVDSPVIRDAMTQQPIIPGSSIKGNLRTLLVRTLVQKPVLPKPEDDPEVIIRLFGAGGKTVKRGRLQFADCYLKNAEDLKRFGFTEVKFENTIKRTTSTATPRQIERVIRGAIFAFNLVYDIDDTDQIQEDFENLALALKTLQLDYLGGHGSRGYGKVRFTNFAVQVMNNNLDPEVVDELLEKLKEVETDGLCCL